MFTDTALFRTHIFWLHGCLCKAQLELKTLTFNSQFSQLKTEGECP